MKNFSEIIINFYSELIIPKNLPNGVSIMNPYSSGEVKQIIEKFCRKFFNDNRKRVYVVGINPGRFGGGITGIPFTDPINLEEKCGIKNSLDKKAELSSRFVYMFIDVFGGVKKFYKSFFITAIYPLALIKEGKNFNYYDDQKIYKKLKPEIVQSFQNQLNIGARKDVVICLGKKNEKYLREINKKLKWFEKIITLEHPRYIMQYKYKSRDKYAEKFVGILNSVI